MEITNIPLEKKIFTAKTDYGFVGCCRIDQGIVFTAESFPKALAAANAARKLKKELGDSSKQAVVDSPLVKKQLTASKNPAVPVTSSKHKEKKRAKKTRNTYVGTLYTTDEVEKMPLLRFKEVWVITRYEDYVSDALNGDKKCLVAYCQRKEQAKPFKNYEEANRIMRTLKATVGPGFSLQRFFVRTD